MEGFTIARKLLALNDDLNLQHALLVAVHHQIDPFAKEGIDGITLHEAWTAREVMFEEYYGNPRCATILCRINDICYEYEAIRRNLEGAGAS